MFHLFRKLEEHDFIIRIVIKEYYFMELQLLIADDDVNFSNSICKYIKNEIPRITTIKIAHDGFETLEYINEFNPNILLLDLNMPKISGIEVLKKIQNKNTKIILISGETKMVNKLLISDFCIIEKICIKPFELKKLKEDLQDLICICEKDRLEALINEKLSEFNFNKGTNSYKYLVRCIREIYEKPEELNNIEKLLFPKIAIQLGINNHKTIKWSLEKLINSMARFTDSKIILDHFPYTKKPTTKMFLSEINNYLTSNY